MAIFKKGSNDQGGSGARDKVSAALRNAGTEGSISIIGPGMQIVGDVVTDGTVRVEGKIHGTLRASKSVVIGRDGEVLGDVVAAEAVIGGTVRGTVTTEGRMQLQSTCDIEGEIRTNVQHLLLEEGARFNGQVHMLPAGEVVPETLIRSLGPGTPDSASVAEQPHYGDDYQR
jgi:cytoskeletal protein CcmA (bactofilin family)